MQIALIVMAFNTGLSLLLLKPMMHVGLALATSLAAWLHVGLLLSVLWHHKIYQLQRHFVLFIGRIFVANAVLSAVLLVAQPSIIQWLHWGAGERVFRLLLLIVLGMVSYLISLWLLRFNWKEILR